MVQDINLIIVIMKCISKFSFDPANYELEHGDPTYKVEETNCLSLREIYNRFKNGYPLDRSLVHHDDEAQNYDDSAIDVLDKPDYQAEFDDLERLQRKLDYEATRRTAVAEAEEQRDDNDKKDVSSEAEKGE